jgi:hypothetical protein
VVARSSDGGGGASRRWLRPSLVIGIRVVGGKTGGSGEPHPECPAPTSLLYAQCNGGPPVMDGLGAPDQGAVQGPKKVVRSSMDRRSI